MDRRRTSKREGVERREGSHAHRALRARKICGTGGVGRKRNRQGGSDPVIVWKIVFGVKKRAGEEQHSSTNNLVFGKKIWKGSFTPPWEGSGTKESLGRVQIQKRAKERNLEGNRLDQNKRGWTLGGSGVGFR